MDTRYYLTCLWPGLPELWWRGRLSALPTAIAFAVAVNAILITRYLYPEWLPRGLVSMAFWVGLIAWGFSVYRCVRELPTLLAPRRAEDHPDQFPEARTAYLRGNWTAAEGLLSDVLAIEPRDPPALLLLAGIYRHTNRLEAAEVLLQEIVRLEVADSWGLEVEAEIRRLQRAIVQSEESEENSETEGQKLDTDTENHAAEMTARTRKAA
jgi:hypothetical protein